MTSDGWDIIFAAFLIMVAVTGALIAIAIYWGVIVSVFVACGTFAFNIATSISEYLLN